MTRFFARFKSLVLALVLLSFSFSMMFSKIHPNTFQLRTVLFSVAVGVERGFVTVGESLVNVFTGIRRIHTLEARLEEAQQRLQTYREYAFLYEQLKKENDNYRNMLDIRERINDKAIYAKVIFRDPSLLAGYFTINKGRIDGIKQNMPVITPSSNDRMVLVGKIVETGRTTSKVQLITAKNFFLGIRLADTGYTGILSGQGSWNQDLVLNYVPIEADPALGEEVLTSGESEIYPAGLLVGKVRGIGQNVMEEYFQILYVSPEMNYTRLPDVFILNSQNNLVQTGELP